MPTLTLAKARKILNTALAHAEEKALKPLAVVVLDERGVIKAAASQDGTSLMRFEVAFGKAFGALGMGVGSRTIGKMAGERPHFVSAYVDATGGRCVPVPGGVLIKDAKGAVLGAVGISGDTSDADEAAAVTGITAGGLSADPGAA
jgi:uncharacterized protein GlcG (DUF336 family)